MKGRRILLFVLLGVVVFGSGVYCLRSREPVYQGVALSIWLRDLESQVTHDPAAEAVRQMGTAALPLLLNMLRAKDSKFKLKLKEWAGKQSLFEFHFSSADDYHIAATRGFIALGPMAEPAIPSLIILLGDEDFVVRAGASSALNVIGSKAVLPLMKALTNVNSRVRAESAGCLGYIGSDDSNILAALIHNLKDKDAIVRGCTANSLGEIGKGPNAVIPALMETLHDTDASVRAFSAQAIGKFGEDAKPAVSALLKALSDQDRIVRIRATSALIKIDPEAAAKAGVKFPIY